MPGDGSHQSDADFSIVLVLSALLVFVPPALSQVVPDARQASEPLGRIELPAGWRAQFWKSSDAQALLRLCPRELADLVPVQAGLRFCRCPACGAEERDDALSWSVVQPNVLKCRRCGVPVPNDSYPAKVNKEVPEEKVEVLPGIVHHYSYHAVEDSQARYPDERLYLQAKCDYEARKYLARAALYAAAESHSRAPSARDRQMTLLACVIMLRFAQVYPAYAIHCDQPGRSKQILPARLQPPYRRGYQSGKWEWSGCLEVPLNLVAACALLKGDPAWAEAGRLLDDPAPERTVEREFFFAAAEFAKAQPEEFSEDAVHVYRGVLAVGRLLGDHALMAEAMARLDGFARRGFYHDGFWRQAEIRAHRRIVSFLDGWVGSLLPAQPDAAEMAAAGPAAPLAGSSSATKPRDPSSAISMLDLARKASAAVGSRALDNEVQQASWPSPPGTTAGRRPVLLGGAGLARLALGEGEGTLDVEVRGLDSYSGPHFQRLALRLSVAGLPVLDDLDEGGETATGWELATPSHNTVVVDGLNQRETPIAARSPAAGSDFHFFAADQDFQVVAAEDPRAYPQSTTRYRLIVVGTSSARTRYALSVFQVEGGLQHDQIYHAAPGRRDRWALPGLNSKPPASLLPPSITFLPSARPDQGRWFVQAYGEFQLEAQATWTRPTLAQLVPVGMETTLAVASRPAEPPGPTLPLGLRLHVLGDAPLTVFTEIGRAHV